jgi:enterochelin esterase family protein
MAIPAAPTLPIILPPDYASNSKRYPVIYGLTGFTGSGPMMLNVSAWQPNLQERIDRLMNQGKLPPAIYVLPDCFTRYGGSQYVNSLAIGRYEDYVIDEIVPHIDRTYRTSQNRRVAASLANQAAGMDRHAGMKHPKSSALVSQRRYVLNFVISRFPCFKRHSKAGGVDKWLNEFEHKAGSRAAMWKR